MSTWSSSLRSLFSRNPELDLLMSPHSAHSVGVWGDNEETQQSVYANDTSKVSAKDGTLICNFSVLFEDRQPNEDIRSVIARNIFKSSFHEDLRSSGYSHNSLHSRQMTLTVDGREVHQVVYHREQKPLKYALRSLCCCKPNIEPNVLYESKEYFVGYELILPESARAGRRRRK